MIAPRRRGEPVDTVLEPDRAEESVSAARAVTR